MLQYIQGDLVKLAQEGKFNIVMHGCNCFCTMGAGIARQIKETFPEAYRADLQTKKGDHNKLGAWSIAWVQQENSDFTLLNAYTQYDYRRNNNGACLVNYDAVRKIFRDLRTMLIDMNTTAWVTPGTKPVNYVTETRIGIPKIGAGLAGGDWSIIEQIILEEASDLDITVVTLP